MMQGTLIVLEGVDASGKETQAKLLFERLEREGKDARLVTFPDYESEASYPIRLYLAGKLGKNLDEVNAYSAATFFAVDRLISYLTKWKKFYEQGGLVLADRYIPSNMVHQAVKLETKKEREDFWAWLIDLELDKFHLPAPSLVLFLDMEIEAALLLKRKRLEKEGLAPDIHEQDEEYLRKCYHVYQTLAEKNKWARILCTKEKRVLSKEEIHEQIYGVVKKYCHAHL